MYLCVCVRVCIYILSVGACLRVHDTQALNFGIDFNPLAENNEAVVKLLNTSIFNPSDYDLCSVTLSLSVCHREETLSQARWNPLMMSASGRATEMKRRSWL